MQSLSNQPQNQFPQTPNPTGSPQMQPGFREQQLKLAYNAAGSNFYSIATFSLINSVINYFQGNLYFPIGLGITQIIDGFSSVFQLEVPASSTMFFAIGVILDLLIFAMVAIFGFIIRKQVTWLIPIGAALYLIDGLLLLLFKDWISAAFHAYFLFRFWTSWQAIRRISKSAVPQKAMTPL